MQIEHDFSVFYSIKLFKISVILTQRVSYNKRDFDFEITTRFKIIYTYEYFLFSYAGNKNVA